MAEENVELVRGLVDGFMETDLVPVFADEAQRRAMVAAFEPILDPECEFLAATGGMPALDGEFRGREAGFDAFLRGANG